MREKIIFGSSVLLVMLFSYATIAKASDIEIFRSQMMQSPLLPESLVGFLSYAVPGIEILTVFLLVFEKTKLVGLYFAYSIMFAFSVYLIMLVTLFKGNIPCACGGILGQMGYTAHIIFNILFTLLALISILALLKKMDKA